jgi:hypothetical protein
MTQTIVVGDRVQVLLDSKYWHSAGWLEGTVVRIDPYSSHRCFFWVELDVAARPSTGGASGMISILNPKNIRKIPPG